MTLVAVIAALAIYCSPAAARLLVYDRLQILAGQGWRVFTGQWVHFTGSALLWNLVVLIPAGVWAEWINPVRARVLYGIAPLLIGGVLYFFVPGLERYAGLSGLAAAMLAFLALTQLRNNETDRWFWRCVMGALALKIIAEAIRGSPLFAHMEDPGLRGVPLVHLAGVAAAFGAHSFRRARRAT